MGKGSGFSLDNNLLGEVNPAAVGQFTTQQRSLANDTALANKNIGGSTMNAVEQGGADTAGAMAAFDTTLAGQQIQNSELQTLANANNANNINLASTAGLLGGLLG